MEDEDLPIEMEEDASNADKSKDEGLSHEHTATLERLKQKIEKNKKRARL